MEITLAKVPLPCSAVQLENAILRAAHNGHWHDAKVNVHGNKLVLTYEDEDAYVQVERMRQPGAHARDHFLIAASIKLAHVHIISLLVMPRLPDAHSRSVRLHLVSEPCVYR